MYQLLIVDDERSVLDALTLLIPWKDHGVDAVFRACSSRIALELLHENSIDIVICDIRMPGLSGLELIALIRKQWPQTKCILLSGHTEFEYAKEAIRLQACAYLLKPARPEEVIEAVHAAQAELRRDWEMRVSVDQARKLICEHLPQLRSNLLARLLLGAPCDVDQLTERMGVLSLPFQGEEEVRLLLMRVEADPARSGEAAHYPEELMELAVSNTLEEVFTGYYHLWHTKDPLNYLVFVIGSDRRGLEGADPELTAPEARKQQLENLAAQFQRNVNAFLGIRVSMTISRNGILHRDLPALYNSAVAAMRVRVGNDSDVFYAQQDDSQSVYEADTFESLYRLPSLMHLFESSQWEAAEARIEEMIAEINQRHKGNYEYVQEAFHAIYSAFVRIAHMNGKMLTSIAQQAGEIELLLQRERIETASQLSAWAGRLCALIKRDIINRSHDLRRGIIHQVYAYIADHLSQDVSLSAIARHVHLHAVYLSRIFKLETGATLGEYILQEKMKSAANLLKTTELRIYEVAQAVGYESSYFMKVFKKYFGLTPQEYREG